MASVIPKRLKDEIELWMEGGKYGHLQINFAGGKIINVNKVESVKVEHIGTVTLSLANTSFTQTTPKS